MIGWLLLAFFSGVVAVLVVELYVFVKWFKSIPSKEPVRAEYTPSSLREVRKGERRRHRSVIVSFERLGARKPLQFCTGNESVARIVQFSQSNLRHSLSGMERQRSIEGVKERGLCIATINMLLVEGSF